MSVYESLAFHTLMQTKTHELAAHSLAEKLQFLFRLHRSEFNKEYFINMTETLSPKKYTYWYEWFESFFERNVR